MDLVKTLKLSKLMNYKPFKIHPLGQQTHKTSDVNLTLSTLQLYLNYYY